MARGITETDVWNACDALLLEGGRPTIERVRLKIGSGSPNTVSPHLDTWFKHLGGRITDPGAFSVPSNVPDPVMQAAKHFWEAALAETRRDFDQRLGDGMAAAIANVEAEKARADQADEAAFDALTKATHLQAQLAERAATLDTERMALVAARSDLANARQAIQALEARFQRNEQALALEREQHRDALALATERADGATRRAALEIEHERQARAVVEKRLTAAQSKLEDVRAEFVAEIGRTVLINERLTEQRKAAIGELELARLSVAQASEKTNEMQKALTGALSRADRAEAEAQIAKGLLARLKPRPLQRSATSKRGAAKAGT